MYNWKPSTGNYLIENVNFKWGLKNVSLALECAIKMKHRQCQDELFFKRCFILSKDDRNDKKFWIN